MERSRRVSMATFEGYLSAYGFTEKQIKQEIRPRFNEAELEVLQQLYGPDLKGIRDNSGLPQSVIVKGNNALRKVVLNGNQKVTRETLGKKAEGLPSKKENQRKYKNRKYFFGYFEQQGYSSDIVSAVALPICSQREAMALRMVYGTELTNQRDEQVLKNPEIRNAINNFLYRSKPALEKATRGLEEAVITRNPIEKQLPNTSSALVTTELVTKKKGFSVSTEMTPLEMRDIDLLADKDLYGLSDKYSLQLRMRRYGIKINGERY